MMTQFDFSDKTALVTGATRGIGKAIADLLYTNGANLILTGTKEYEINELNQQLKTEQNSRKKYFQVDFSDSDSVGLFLKKIDTFEKIDICVNNAGVNKINEFAKTKEEDYDWMHKINLKVPYQILKVVGPKMVTNNYGRIVNIASIWSVVTRPGRSLYTTTKNALAGMTETIAVEWAPYNILANAVSPGFTLTELTKTTNTEEQLAAIEGLIPMKRMANPVEIARVVAFLCSDLNTYLTGQNITVDGGYTNV